MNLKKIPSRFLAAAITLVLLLGLAAETLSRPTPVDAEPFHARMRAAREAVPSRIGDWAGEEVPIPAAAVALLKPNALLSRRYVNQRTGRVASFLLVQCRDARDMSGHYPPVCYPANGWQEVSARPVEWSLGERRIAGMEYQYSRVAGDQVMTTAVSNVIALPDGRYGKGMQEVRELAADYLRRFYGAAQIQVVLDASLPEEERRAIFCELVGANLPLLEALGSGGHK